jgi:acyl carrier protein
MNDAEIRALALRVLQSIAPEIDEIDLRDDKPLRAQIDLDSMDWLNFLLGLHRELSVDIPESDYARLVTLADLVAYLRQRI